MAELSIRIQTMINQNDDAFYDDLKDIRILAEVRSALSDGGNLKDIARQLGVDERELRIALNEPCWMNEPADSSEG